MNSDEQRGYLATMTTKYDKNKKEYKIKTKKSVQF